MMLPQAVMGLFWNLVLNGYYGVLNQILDFLGLGQPQWLTDPDLKFFSILMIDVWMWTPFMMLIGLAALNAIPAYIYEAAAIDRASRWTVFWRITLPMCAPLLGLAVLLRATDALKQFDLVMAVTGPNDEATQTLSALLYQVMFRDGSVGLGVPMPMWCWSWSLLWRASFCGIWTDCSRRRGRWPVENSDSGFRRRLLLHRRAAVGVVADDLLQDAER